VFVVDVAVVHPLAAAHLRAAQRSAAGAATAYEAVKREHYAPAMADAPEEVELANCGFAAHCSSSSWAIGATTSHPDRQWHLVPFLSVSISIG
jgi:hypothetical protein